MGRKLTKAAVDAAAPREEDYFLWDSELKGFGVKIAKGGRKSYVCKYRVGSGRAGGAATGGKGLRETGSFLVGAQNPCDQTVSI